MEGLINVKSDVQRKIKLFAGVFNQQNKTKEERRVSYFLRPLPFRSQSSLLLRLFGPRAFPEWALDPHDPRRLLQFSGLGGAGKPSHT